MKDLKYEHQSIMVDGGVVGGFMGWLVVDGFRVHGVGGGVVVGCMVGWLVGGFMGWVHILTHPESYI